MPSFLAGGARKVTVPTANAMMIKSILQMPAPTHIKTKGIRVTFYAPDGNDGPGGPAANTDVVFVGPNGEAAFPLGPGRAITFRNVNPWTCAVVSPSAGQVVFWGFGGEDAE